MNMKKCMNSCWSILAAWVVAGLAVAPIARGEGVTIITHGYNPSVAGAPAWPASLRADIAANKLGGEALYGTITVTGSAGALVATCSPWSFNITNSTKAEVLVVVDWSAVADHLTTHVTAQSVATAVVAKIIAGQNGQPALAELPIHLVGHSRGGGMVCEIARQLGEKGVVVDHLTPLDPHPLTSSDAQPILPPTPIIDTPAAICQNVVFADVYYQTAASPTGQYLSGAYNRLWSSTLAGGYYNNTPPNNTYADHRNILLAYQGTVNPSASFSNGEATLGATERAAWFNAYEASGTNTGISYSRIDGRSDRTSTGQPVAGGDAVRAGLNNASVFGGAGARSALSWSAAVWPNVAQLDVLTNGTALGSGACPITIGTTPQLRCVYLDYDSGCTVTLRLDADRNPYNSNDVAVISTQVVATASGGSYTPFTNTWNTAGLTNGTTAYVYAQVTDGTRSRYFYAAPVLQFTAPPPPTNTVWYVDAARPDDTGDGATWATAKQTIQAAVDAAGSGHLVWVTNGTYNAGGAVAPGAGLTNRVCITNAITVRSVNGPANTLIVGAPDPVGENGNGPAAVRCVYLVTNAVVSGFTLTNGNTFSDDYFSLNDAGGGVLFNYGGTVSNCVVTDCSAHGFGGGAYFDHGGTLAGCTVSGNFAVSGGGVCCKFGGTLNDCTISTNSTYGDPGGGVYCWQGGTLNNCVINGNYSENSGGGVYCYQGGTLNSCTLSGNTVQGSGAGVYCRQGGTLNDCILSGNSATNQGGGAYCYLGGTLSHCKISSNSAGAGGGAYCSGNATLTNCAIRGNSTTGGGAGAFFNLGGTLYTCVLSGNSAGSTGGGAYFGNGGTLDGCTLSGNEAARGSAAYYNAGGAVSNCIAFGNTPGGSQNIEGDGSCTIRYTCSPGLTGLGNITNDPRFVNAAAGDYRLAPGSPCINGGTNETWMASATDMAGNPRILGGTMDMGAYEYATPAITITNTVTTVPATQTTIVIGGTNNAYVTGMMVYTNAATGASGSFPAQTPWLSPAIALAYGLNTITVTGTNSVGGATSSVVTITRTPLITYVAPGGSNVWPYATWADAATTIQAAVDAVSSNGTVWVTNGVYAAGGSVTPGCALSNRVSLTKAITLQSVNGPSATFIVGAAHPATTNGTSAMRCVWMNAGALVGFTLTNGHTFATGGSWNYDVAGGGLNLSGSASASNCVIVGCSAAHGGGVTFVGAGALEMSTVQNCRSDGQGGGLYFNGGGTISRCIVRNNRTSSDNGGGAYLFGGGLARSSLFVQNTAASSGGGALMDNGGLLENCTVVSNTCPNSGGGVYVWQSGTNLNTIIQYNTATGATSNYTAGASGVIRYCCTTPLAAGTGNIIAAPLFVGGGDYRLQTGSPCINTGTNQAWMSTATDLAGLPRVLDTYADMGAYEYAGAPVVDITTANANVANATTNTTLAGTANAWVVGMLIWTNPAAAVGGTWPASASWSIPGVPLAPGPNTITVSGTNVAGTSASDTVTFTRDPNAGPGSPVHYVALDSPAAAWPYTNWTSAAHTLQDAVDTADTGDTVLVSNGVYSVGGKVIPGKTLLNRVFITTGITVQSLNGPTNTFIVGAGPRGTSAVRGAYLSAGVLSGFTLTNGNTRAAATPDWLFERSGGGVFFNNGGSLSNCIVTRSSATEGGGGVFLYQNGVLNNCTIQGNSSFGGSEGIGGGGVYIQDNGTLNHCLISGNTATKVTGTGGAGGGVMMQYGGDLNNCIISNNSASINGGGGVEMAAGGRLNNSTICYNTTSGGGGGVQLESGGAIYNCLVYANSAGDQGGGAYLVGGGALNNCTLAGNTSQADGGGAYLFEGGTLNNCIVYGNTQSGAWNIGVFGAGSTVRYTCSPGLSGSGNITNNPAFVNAAANNYRLSAGSPCINAGTNAYVQGATDLDGTSRIIGGVVDMGAYESTSGSTANGISWSWLLQYGLATDGSADHLQADADTFDNLQEYIADLNPTNAASYFRITDISNSPTTTVSFVASANRRYTLIGVTNLSSGAWSPVPGAGPRLGTGAQDSLSDTNVPPKGPFYKLQVELP